MKANSKILKLFLILFIVSCQLVVDIETGQAVERDKSSQETTYDSIQSRTLNNTYVLANDSDFEFIRASSEEEEVYVKDGISGYFKYKGNSEYVEIPARVQGISLYSYFKMFENSNVKGVKSTNSNVVNMSYMFKGSKSDTLDVSQLNTSSVVYMVSMFENSKAKSLNLSNFKTSKVTNMSHMFNNSEATVINLSNFDTSNVIYMVSMFQNSKPSVLNLSNFNTSNVISMNSMFMASQATNINLSSFDTAKVDNMTHMFAESNVSNLDLKHFNTVNVLNMSHMFRNSKVSELDLSSFDMKDADTTSMFAGVSPTIGYARTQNDANILNASSGKPSKLMFFVYQEPTITITPNGSLLWDKQFTFNVSAKGYDTRFPIEIAWSPDIDNDNPQRVWDTLPNNSTRTKEGLNGGHYLHVRMTDLKGKTFYKRSANKFNFDNNPPSLKLTASTSNYTNKDVVVTVDCHDNESGIRRVYIQNKDNNKDLSGSTFIVQENGEYTVTAEDNLGNETTETISITNIDKINPTVTVVQDIVNQTTDNVKLTVTAKDIGSGVKRTQDPKGQWVNKANLVYEVNDNGKYTFKVEDNAGNVITKTHQVSNIIRTRSLNAPTIKPFGTIVIPNKTTEYTAEVTSLGVSDWTLTNNTWRVTLSATPLMHTNKKDTLPLGSVFIKKPTRITHPNGEVTSDINNKQIIDKGDITLLTGRNTFGEIQAEFSKDALSIQVDPSIVKKGSYSTTITWSLVTAP